MDKIRISLALAAFLGVLVSALNLAVPVVGLSTMLGTIILISTIISTTIITTTIVSTTIISSVVLGANPGSIFSPYIASYSAGIYFAQILIAIGSIATLIFIELYNPKFAGNVGNKASDLRKVLIPFSAIVAAIFFIIFLVRAILALA